MIILVIQALLVVIVVSIAVGGYFVWDRRYRGGGRGDFRPTDEVFHDPASGKLTRVWEDPATGRREYREEPPG